MARNQTYFSVLRPLIKENNELTGKYYNSKCVEGLSQVYTCTDSLEDYNITDSSQSRLKYKNISIEKTVDVWNKSVVEIGDTLKYTIDITNNSSSDYSDINIVENISENVEIIDDGAGTVHNNEISWNIETTKNKNSKCNPYYSEDKDITLILSSFVLTMSPDKRTLDINSS